MGCAGRRQLPALAGIQSRTVDAQRICPAVVRRRKGASPMQIDTRITFGGLAHSFWTFHPFTSDGESGKIDFSGGSVRVDYDRTLRKSDATGQFDSLKWADGAGGQGTITNFTVEGHNTVDRKSTRLNSSH